MKTKTISAVILLLITALLTPAATARIGETLEQCRSRYGMETKTSPAKGSSPGFHFFSKNGFLISASFLPVKAARVGQDAPAAKVGMLMFNKTTAGMAIPAAQIEQLLSVNAGGSTWQPSPDNATADIQTWQTADGKLTARYMVNHCTLLIITAEQKAHNQATTATHEKTAVQDF